MGRHRGFRPITAHPLAADLQAWKQGFLVAVEAAGERIVGMVHAVYDLRRAQARLRPLRLALECHCRA